MNSADLTLTLDRAFEQRHDDVTSDNTELAKYALRFVQAQKDREFDRWLVDTISGEVQRGFSEAA